MRRGFQPETFMESAMACSLSKTDIVLNWESIETANRKALDPKSNRYMVVFDPVKIFLKNYPKTDFVRLNLHPDFPGRGKRLVPLRSFVYISKPDLREFARKEIRLKGLFNAKLVSNMAVYTGDKVVTHMPKLQWVSEPNVAVEVIKPEGKAAGIGEPAMKKLKRGETIQMERVGFARVESNDGKKVTVYFAHE
jgi:glutamyl-tRNA synthetase